MDRDLSLAELVKEVVSSIQEVDEHVLHSDYIKHEVLGLGAGEEPVGYDYSNPEAYLSNFDSVRFWEAYFEFLIREWDDDDDGDRLSEARLNFIIDRLSVAASAMDRYGPRLVRMYRNIPNVPEGRIQGILRRRTVLNGFLNSAEITLEHWYRHAGILQQRTLRQRRRLPEPSGAELDEGPTSHPILQESQTVSNGPLINLPRKVLRLAVSETAVLTFTATITLAAAIIQGYSLNMSLEATNEPQPGVLGSSDFLTTVQNVLMQLLGLYVTLIPAFEIRRLYAWWCWVMAVCGVISLSLTMIFYVQSPAISQFLLFLGSAAQSIIIIQLGRVAKVTAMEARQEKDE